MSGTELQLWSSGGVIALCAFAAAIVGPYAFRMLVLDVRGLPGQFAASLAIVFAGVSGRLSAAWVFYFTEAADRPEMLETLHPWILLFNLLIALGALMCIRLVSAGRYGEWLWISVLALSVLLATVVYR